MPVPDQQHSLSQSEAVIKRVAPQMPVIDRARLRRLRRSVVRNLQKYFGGMQFDADENFEFDEYIENTNYPRYRKEELRNVHNKNFDPKKGTAVKAFIKDESYPEYKAFRTINSRNDDYKTRVGPFFQKLSKKIFTTEHFIKKIPVAERPKFIKKRFEGLFNLFCTDFSSFEATFGPLLLRVEFLVYDWFLKYNNRRGEIMRLIRQGIGGRNRVVFKDFAYIIDGRRMSGEMNTSEGNGIMNMLMTFFLLEEAGNKVLTGYFEGDDGICFYHPRTPTAQDYADLGAKIKIEIPGGLNKASFCGLIFDEEVEDNVCNITEALMSFGYTTSQYANSCRKKKMALLRSKSLSMLYSYPGCPILKSLAKYGLRMTDEISNEYLKWVLNRQNLNTYERELLQIENEYFENKQGDNIKIRDTEVFNRPIDYRTRKLVEDVYNISIDNQKLCEDYLDNKTDLSPIVLPSLLSLVHPDQIDYYQRYSMTIHENNTISNKYFTHSPGRVYKIWKNNINYKNIS